MELDPSSVPFFLKKIKLYFNFDFGAKLKLNFFFLLWQGFLVPKKPWL
jgi:hypothetical protein